ncbi:MAG: NHLP family bacteriocin export ABC transporter peptidase/permease/ATPase subunit [Thermodesulfobacteriota bacterium]
MRWRRSAQRGTRARTPTVLQYEAVECGAAALGSILGHFGHYVPLEELRIDAGVSRDGSRATNILRAARLYGLEASGAKASAGEVEALDLPCIVFWNRNHFLVVEGFGRDVVYLNDPAMGPRTVTRPEFVRSYSGVALSFRPGPDFRADRKPPSMLPSLARRLRGSEPAVVYAVLTGLLLSLAGLVTPTFQKVFIDDYIEKGFRDWVVPLLWIMLATAVVVGFVTWLQRYYLLRLSKKISISASSQFLWHVLRLPLEFFGQRFAGEIGSRVALNDKIASVLSGRLATTIVALVTLLPYALILLSYDVTLTVIGVGMAMLNLVALQLISRLRVDGNRRYLQERGKMIGTATSGLLAIESIKASGGENDFFARVAGYQGKVVDAQQDLGRLSQVLDRVPKVLASLNATLMLCLGAYLVIRGSLSVGMVVAFQALMTTFTTPFADLVGLGSTMQTLQGDLNRLDDALAARLDPEVRDQHDGPRVEVVRGKLDGFLEFRRVSFGYSRVAPPLLVDFDLRIAPGQRVAIVGGSGSGKSTVARLAAGLHQPWSGEVLLDGKPRSAWPRGLLTASVAHVDQDIFLFDGTVLENLTLWDPTLPDEVVIAAAQDAGIHDEIASRPAGYLTRVEQGGANFSGGQRQRLEIARALALEPSILILDEATSALDPRTEVEIDSNLRRRGISCLIVAHRLSTIRDADEIVVLHEGRVVERGRHDELKERKGAYAALIGA